MAGFKAHFFTAAVAGGTVATSLLSVGVLTQNSLLLCFAAAILGGVLPDIDSDTSTVLNVSFTSFSLIISFFILFSQVEQLSTVESLLLWFSVFLFFKLFVFNLFTKLTVHRGIFHSIPAAFLSLFFTTTILSRLFELSNQIVWLAGSFLFMGFIIHLLLDELASLNIFSLGGVRKSFGSAAKLYSADLTATGILYLATVLFYTLTPATDGIFSHLTDPLTVKMIAIQFLPTDGWFSHIIGR
ncbi:MAG: metal-dependent hydrolase [Magnetococcales bacterium]|nr:metal-dependent hydrolase [Magnetococcales bacterium]